MVGLRFITTSSLWSAYNLARRCSYTVLRIDILLWDRERVVRLGLAIGKDAFNNLFDRQWRDTKCDRCLLNDSSWSWLSSSVSIVSFSGRKLRWAWLNLLWLRSSDVRRVSLLKAYHMHISPFRLLLDKLRLVRYSMDKIRLTNRVSVSNSPSDILSFLPLVL